MAHQRPKKPAADASKLTTHPAQHEAEPRREDAHPMQGEVVAQNDVADVLLWLAGKLKFWPAAANFLTDLANWFEDLDAGQQDFVVARFGSISDCSAELLDQVKFDLTEAATGLVVKVPERMRDYLDCMLDREPSAQTVVARSAVVKCAMDAVFYWVRTRDWQAAATQFVICLMSGIGGGGTTPTQPPPSGPPGIFKEVRRC